MSDPGEWTRRLAEYLEGLTKTTGTLQQQIAESFTKLNRKIDASRNSDKIRFPDVESFDGKDNKLFRPWVNQMEVFFDTQPEKFKDDKTRIFYAGNRLRGEAMQWFGRNLGTASSVGTEDHVWTSWIAFTDSMRDLFGRRDEDIDARRRIDTLKQGNRDLVAYLNEFEQLDSRAALSEELKVYVFKRGLHQDLRDRLAIWNEDTTSFPALVRALLQISRQTEEYERQFGGRRRPPAAVTNSSNVPAPAKVPDGDVMDWSTDAVNTPRGPLSEAEKQRRRTEGLCHYCAAKGHVAANCPLRPQQKAAPRNTALPGQNSEN